MPPRRAHNKSRKGCLQCKQRRVKCSEVSPRCGQCTTRGLACSYSSVPNLGGAGKIPSNTVTVTEVSTDTDLTTNAEDLTIGGLSSADHKLELELLHMYSTSTYKACITNAENASARDLWQYFIPREALRHDFLMKAILAFASLHVATTMDDTGKAGNGHRASWVNNFQGEMPFDGSNTSGLGATSTGPCPMFSSRPSVFYYQKALEYQTQASSSFRPVLNRLSPENCHAVLGFSIIMVYLALGIPHHSITEKMGDFGSGTTPMQSIFTMFEFLRGIESVSAVGQAWLNAGPFGQFIHGYDEFWEMEVQFIDPNAAEAFQRLHSLNDGKYGHYFTSEMSEDNHSRYETNKSAITHLATSFAKVTQGNLDPALPKVSTPEEMWGERGPILAWLGLVGPVFISYLHDGESLSLLVFLHWGVLLHHLSDLWWSRNSGRLLVEEISCILHGRGKEWEERTRWARTKVGLLQ